ncbi:MAG TPA: hypothetical protein PLF84_09060 [Bryobacteraceae bacterium]|nr:hypothetical protein [Bryobacteraceae bacterium]
MIDLHCHFLPGLDDGARDEAESAEMLRIAASSGTNHLVATPHADTRYHFDPDLTARLLDLARAAAPPSLTLSQGCDFHIMHDNLVDALAHPRRYTLNASRYLLIELSDIVIFPNTGEMFDRLEQAGLRIIISHPERNPILRQRPELLLEWIEQDRLVQVTASALTGQWGVKVQAFARRLLEQNHVHFIASDGHSVRGRPPRLDLARSWIEEKFSPALAHRLLVANPAAVVADQDLPQPEIPDCKPVADKQPWWRRLLPSSRTPPDASKT